MKSKQKIEIILRMMSNNIRVTWKYTYKFLPNIIHLINPFVFVLVVNTNGLNTFKFPEVILPFVLWHLALILKYLREDSYSMVGDIPVSNRRYTKRDDKGNIQFNSKDVYEIAEYLAELEEVLENKGAYRKVVK